MEKSLVEGCWTWADTVEKPNYMFMQQMALSFLHAMMLFRTLGRKYNAEVIMSTRETYHYCLMTLNKFVETMMPAEVKDVFHSSYTLRVLDITRKERRALRR